MSDQNRGGSGPDYLTYREFANYMEGFGKDMRADIKAAQREAREECEEDTKRNERRIDRLEASDRMVKYIGVAITLLLGALGIAK